MGGVDRHIGRAVKIFAVGGMVIFLLFPSISLAGDDDTAFLTGEEQNWLKAHPTIRMAYDENYPPIEFVDSEGEYQGFAADFVSAIERILGVNFTLVRYSNRSAILEAIRLRRADMVSSFARTPEREKYMLFSEPFFNLPVVIICRQSVKGPLGFDDLKGMRVAVIRAQAIQGYLEEKYPEIQLDLVEDSEVGLKKVSFGVDDAFIGNLATSTYIITKTNITNLQVVGEAEVGYDLCLATRDDWPIFRSILDKALKRISDEERETIIHKWIHLTPRPIISNRQLLVWGVVGFGFVCLLLGGFFVWTISLKRMVRRRTLELDRELVERRRVEDEMRKLNDELESRVMVRTAELAVANRELESFCYSVSHDLRTPLRSLDGFSQILLDTCDVRLNDEGKDCLRRIRAASQRMSLLIDDLLKLARVTRDRMHIATIDLSRLATTISYEVKKMYPNHPVDIVISPGLEVQADESLMEIALRNLLENAWKFTEKRPDPKVEFGSETIDGRQAFFVRDNGVGFDMAYVDKLFKPFQRLHVAPEYQGTGIGLATVQRIISRHGGKVWARGEVNKGATFYFTLE